MNAQGREEGSHFPVSRSLLDVELEPAAFLPENWPGVRFPFFNEKVWPGLSPKGLK